MPDNWQGKTSGFQEQEQERKREAEEAHFRFHLANSSQEKRWRSNRRKRREQIPTDRLQDFTFVLNYIIVVSKLHTHRIRWGVVDIEGGFGV